MVTVGRVVFSKKTFFMVSKSISVILPCYNEAEVIEQNIHTVYEYLKRTFEHYEIIAVSDGSRDRTASLLEHIRESSPEMHLVVIAYKENRGKGYAVRQGVLKSQFDLVLFLDADLTIPIEEIEKFLPVIERSDVVIASRGISGTRFEEPVPWYRSLMARGLKLLQKLIIGNNSAIKDTQCGFKLFRRSVALDIFPHLTIDRFAFDVEILFLVHKRAYSIEQLPVMIRKDLRNSNIRVFRDSIDVFKDLLKIRHNNQTGVYDAVQ